MTQSQGVRSNQIILYIYFVKASRPSLFPGIRGSLVEKKKKKKTSFMMLAFSGNSESAKRREPRLYCCLSEVMNVIPNLRGEKERERESNGGISFPSSEGIYIARLRAGFIESIEREKKALRETGGDSFWRITGMLQV